MGTDPGENKEDLKPPRLQLGSVKQIGCFCTIMDVLWATGGPKSNDRCMVSLWHQVFVDPLWS